jgi:RNA polymerase sigma-70 factor (ECF subfamily)
VIVLHYLEGLSVAEISAEMKIPDGTVKSHLSRGRNAMAALLSEPSEETVASRD